MTASQKTYVKESWKGWITVINFVILILIFLFKSGFTSGKEVTQIRQDILHNTEYTLENTRLLQEHLKTEHLDYEKIFKTLMQDFEPRSELQKEFQAINKQLDRILKKLDDQ